MVPKSSEHQDHPCCTSVKKHGMYCIDPVISLHPNRRQLATSFRPSPCPRASQCPQAINETCVRFSQFFQSFVDHFAEENHWRWSACFTNNLDQFHCQIGHCKYVARHLRRATPSSGAGRSSTCRVPCRIGGAAQWMFEENHVESHPIMRPVPERI